MADFLASTELDFDTKKSELRAYLTGQDKFRDYDFEGSNISQILDLLAQNDLGQAHYLNMVGSEAFLDTAKLREDIVSRAKELNYVPRSRSSSRIIGTLEVFPEDTPSSITIPKNYPIQTTVDDVTYKFITDEAVVVRNNGGQWLTSNLTFYEGEVVTEVFTANVSTINGSTNSYIYHLSSENIDVSSIEVTVQNSQADTTTATWTRKTSLFNLNNESKVYFVEGYRDNRYQVVFGNGIFGKALDNGNIVTITYRDTVGEASNGASNFATGTSIGAYSTVTLTTFGVSYGGAERESNADLKYNATRHFQVQERAVVSEDYKSIVLSNFPFVQAVSAYGGEEAAEKQYGKTIISVKPFGFVGTVSDKLKTQIIELLKLKNMTSEPVIVDPEYFYVDIVSEVQYDKTLTSDTPEQIKTNITNDLIALNLTSFNDFGKDFRYSKIINIIDESTENSAIVSNDTQVRLIKRWAPIVNEYTQVSYSYGNELKGEGVRFVHPTGYESIISTDSFTYNKNNTDYTAYIEDNGNGVLRVYNITSDGTKLILDSNIGTVDYTTGDINFATTVKSYLSYISIYARLENKDIIMDQNKFIIIDSADIDLTVIDFRD